MLKKYWFWFSLIVIAFSTYDYFEHIFREGSSFEKNPIDWLLFSGSATLLLLTFVLFIKRILEKITAKRNIIFEVISIGTWLVLHIYIFGPLLNKLFWPSSQLTFKFKVTGFVIVLGIYFIFRVIVNAIMKKPLFQ